MQLWLVRWIRRSAFSVRYVCHFFDRVNEALFVWTYVSVAIRIRSIRWLIFDSERIRKRGTIIPMIVKQTATMRCQLLQRTANIALRKNTAAAGKRPTMIGSPAPASSKRTQLNAITQSSIASRSPILRNRAQIHPRLKRSQPVVVGRSIIAIRFMVCAPTSCSRPIHQRFINRFFFRVINGHKSPQQITQIMSKRSPAGNPRYRQQRHRRIEELFHRIYVTLRAFGIFQRRSVVDGK
jgi:hypothetical protein